MELRASFNFNIYNFYLIIMDLTSSFESAIIWFVILGLLLEMIVSWEESLGQLDDLFFLN
jgi:hypothetical protein